MNLFASQAVPSVPTALWSLPCVLNLAPSQAGFGAAAGCCLLPAINKLPWAAHPEQTLLCQQGLTLCQRSCCCCLDDKAPLFPPVGTPGFLHMQEIGFFPHINAKSYLRTAGWYCQLVPLVVCEQGIVTSNPQRSFLFPQSLTKGTEHRGSGVTEESEQWHCISPRFWTKGCLSQELWQQQARTCILHYLVLQEHNIIQQNQGL